MTPSERIVLDNNTLISRLLLPASIPGTVFRKALFNSQILVSEATLEELADVFSRPKFDLYVSLDERKQFLRNLLRVAEIVPIVYTVHACRDARDDKILEVAVNGSASVIVTGDKDLLVLNPFHDIPILTPARYLER